MDIALVTNQAYPNLLGGEVLPLEAFSKAGYEASPAVWNDPSVEWRHFDHIILRGCSHAMRNELVEELIIDPEKKVLQNRTGNSSETAKTDEMESNTARREKAEKTSGETRA